VGFEMLLHVVCSSELLRTTGPGTRDCLLGSVDFRVPRGVARGCEGLFADVGVFVAARIALLSSSELDEF